MQSLVGGFLVLRSTAEESELPAPRVVRTFLAAAPMAAPPPPPVNSAPMSATQVDGKRSVLTPPMRFAPLVAPPMPMPIEMGDFTGGRL